MKKRTTSSRSVPKRASRHQFAKLLKFPVQWLEWGMYPHKLYQIQIKEYEPGSEDASEHYRYGAFRWWLAKPLSDSQLAKYVVLTFLEPDQLMAGAARKDLLPKFKRRKVCLKSILSLMTWKKLHLL
ncbi:MAG: hypothetical protein OEY86_18360 [Nitrospira sp.]|nr:hypothetical protein [Nitrospira sp.]